MHTSLRRSKSSMQRFAKFFNWLGAFVSVLGSLLLSSVLKPQCSCTLPRRADQ